MMIKPGITELSKCVDSRYTLVSMAAKRARMIGKERVEDSEAYGKEKSVSVAADEIASGKVGYIRSEAVEKAGEWEREKAAAIMSLAESEREAAKAPEEEPDETDEEQITEKDAE